MQRLERTNSVCEILRRVFPVDISRIPNIVHIWIPILPKFVTQIRDEASTSIAKQEKQKNLPNIAVYVTLPSSSLTMITSTVLCSTGGNRPRIETYVACKFLPRPTSKLLRAAVFCSPPGPLVAEEGRTGKVRERDSSCCRHGTVCPSRKRYQP